MSDHPLIPSKVRTYMEQHQIEQGLNRSLNVVLSTLPQDPFSAMAVTLIDSNPSAPTLVKLVARPTTICDMTQETIQIDVFLNY